MSEFTVSGPPELMSSVRASSPILRLRHPSDAGPGRALDEEIGSTDGVRIARQHGCDTRVVFVDILREFIMEGITYRKDIEETIERYKKRVAKNPEDEIAKEVLQDLEWELRLIDRKEMMDKMREEEPDRWTFFMSGPNINE